MKIVNFNKENSIPHPSFKGVSLYPILNENESLGIRSNYASITPNHEISPHTHDVVEVFTIIYGNPEVLVGGEWIKVVPGTTIVAPPGEMHGVRNNSNEEVLLQANFNCN